MAIKIWHNFPLQIHINAYFMWGMPIMIWLCDMFYNNLLLLLAFQPFPPRMPWRSHFSFCLTTSRRRTCRKFIFSCFRDVRAKEFNDKSTKLKIHFDAFFFYGLHSFFFSSLRTKIERHKDVVKTMWLRMLKNHVIHKIYIFRVGFNNGKGKFLECSK